MKSKEVICLAIRERRRLNFYYDGGQRIIEPYVLGISESSKLILLGYQTGGYSESNEFPPWRSFQISKIRNLTVGDPLNTVRLIDDGLDIGIRQSICSSTPLQSP